MIFPHVVKSKNSGISGARRFLSACTKPTAGWRMPLWYSAFTKSVYIILYLFMVYPLNDLYCLPNIVRVIKSRRMSWAGHVARMGDGRGFYRVLVGKPEGKRPLGRPRRWWEDSIKMDLQEVECLSMDWVDLVQDRDRWWALVSAVMKLRVP